MRKQSAVLLLAAVTISLAYLLNAARRLGLAGAGIFIAIWLVFFFLALHRDRKGGKLEQYGNSVVG